MEISVSRALVELKTLSSRIEKLIENFTPVDIVVNNKLKTGKSRNDFESDVKAGFQQISELISNRDKIKSAIVVSNASTNVTINDKVMTVAQAIERKSSILHEKNFLTSSRNKLVKAMQVVDHVNQQAQDRLDRLLESTFSKDSSKVKADELESVAKPFMSRNEASLVDPLNIDKILQGLDETITKFESEVDIVLSESNARTVITI